MAGRWNATKDNPSRHHGSLIVDELLANLTGQVVGFGICETGAELHIDDHVVVDTKAHMEVLRPRKEHASFSVTFGSAEVRTQDGKQLVRIDPVDIEATRIQVTH